MGFHSLPIEGNPAEDSQRVLEQIESALIELHADNVERVGNRISFSAGIFSLKRWAGPHPLAFVSSGEIKIDPSSDVMMVEYRLRFSQWYVICTVMVLYLATRIGFRSPHQPLITKLEILAFAWLFMFFGNLMSATSRFSKFLRQFPRNDSSGAQSDR
jgi:hypothetical protein